MGSSWRYSHVAITPYSIGGFHEFACTFFNGFLVLFHGLALRFAVRALNSLIGEKLRARIEVNRKTNRPNWPAPPFHSIFQPRSHYIQLDPIYYGPNCDLLTKKLIRHLCFECTLQNIYYSLCSE